MIINEVGEYRLTKTVTDRSAAGMYLCKGDRLHVTGISAFHHKFMSEELLGWHDWDMPVKRVGSSTPVKGFAKLVSDLVGRVSDLVERIANKVADWLEGLAKRLR